MEDKKEIRNTTHEVIISDGEESRKVEGYAMLFDVPSDGLSFEEVIERGALDGVIEKSNVFALLNHDERRGILARSKSGTLSLSVDNKGLRYGFEAPKTALGDELLEYIHRGEIRESSFAFTVDKEEWEKKSNGTWKRTIKSFERIFDVSPVYDAAYSKTSVYMRGKEEAEKKLEAFVKKELEDYYKEFDNILK